MALGQSQPEFLGKSKPIVQRDEGSSGVRDTVSYYSMQRDWLQVLDQAKKELPTAFEHDTTVSGFKAKVLTVPRMEGGRLQMFYPPEKEITFMPRRLALNNSGKVIAIPEHERAWTGIQMRVFRRVKPFESIVEWVHKNLKV